MKPQLYSIVILLLTRINYVQNAETSTPVNTPSATQLSTFPTTTYFTEPKDNVTVTKAPGDHKTPVPETTEAEVTSVTDAPKGNNTSVTKTPTDKAPNSQTASAPSSLAPNVSPVRTTKGFTTTTGSGDTPRTTGSTSVGNQTSKPVVAGKTTTRRSNKATTTLRKTTKLTATKSTTGNRTSALPVPSLFAILLLVVSVLCF